MNRKEALHLEQGEVFRLESDPPGELRHVYKVEPGDINAIRRGEPVQVYWHPVDDEFEKRAIVGLRGIETFTLGFAFEDTVIVVGFKEHPYAWSPGETWSERSGRKERAK